LFRAALRAAAKRNLTIIDSRSLRNADFSTFRKLAEGPIRSTGKFADSRKEASLPVCGGVTFGKFAEGRQRRALDVGFLYSIPDFCI